MSSNDTRTTSGSGSNSRNGDRRDRNSYALPPLSSFSPSQTWRSGGARGSLWWTRLRTKLQQMSFGRAIAGCLMCMVVVFILFRAMTIDYAVEAKLYLKEIGREDLIQDLTPPIAGDEPHKVIRLSPKDIERLALEQKVQKNQERIEELKRDVKELRARVIAMEDGKD